MLIYALSIFLSAFLLFQIQPLISRYILPFFGGTSSVWSTVQLFFQIVLTGGYAYSSWLTKQISGKRQIWVHLTILGFSLIGLVLLGKTWPSPVTPGSNWKPIGVETPIKDIFIILLAAVGFPFFLLSTNSPLMQTWLYRSQPKQSPYWLYALSNIGSLAGLLTYPFVIEPNLNLIQQGWVWSASYLLFVLLASAAAISTWKNWGKDKQQIPSLHQTTSNSKSPLIVQVIWVILSAVGATMLLAITSQITQEVAPIPFLWVLPLSIYLLSFILTYSNERWYNRKFFAALLIPASGGLLWALSNSHGQYIVLVSIYCLILFVCAMICNGETFRLRPDPIHLTHFYLMTSIGGALGGVFVNLAAPLLFKGYWELPVSFGLTWTLILALFVTRKASSQEKRLRFLFNILLLVLLMLVGSLSLYSLGGSNFSGSVYEARNFYGVVRVKALNSDDPAWQGYSVIHGITVHGEQFSARDKRYLPTVYYTEQSGVGLAILNHPKYKQGMKVGILGLGIGTLAAYGQPGDLYRFYEINPIMAELSKGQGGYFSYLGDSPADSTIILGDARISLERELAKSGSNNFNILVLDVFSSDSVPVHLLTKEAFDIYLKNLAPDGILAVNISNRYLNLVPVLWQLANQYNLAMVVIPNESDSLRTYPSNWALMAPNPALLQAQELRGRSIPLLGYKTSIPLWTDDYSNLFQILN